MISVQPRSVPGGVPASNLASHVLGQVAKRLALDWERAHGVRPQLVETCVQSSRPKLQGGRLDVRATDTWEAAGQGRGRGAEGALAAGLTEQLTEEAVPRPRTDAGTVPGIGAAPGGVAGAVREGSTVLLVEDTTTLNYTNRRAQDVRRDSAWFASIRRLNAPFSRARRLGGRPRHAQ